MATSGTMGSDGQQPRWEVGNFLPNMGLSANTTLLLIGAGIGLTLAIAGGFVEYRLSLRAGSDRAQRRLPGCLLYVAGGLALAGIIAIAASLFLSGGIVPALIMGAGVLGGFYSGFACLFILWIILDR